jgi:hypothetical protein
MRNLSLCNILYILFTFSGSEQIFPTTAALYTHTQPHRQNIMDRKSKQRLTKIFLFHLTAVSIPQGHYKLYYVSPLTCHKVNYTWKREAYRQIAFCIKPVFQFSLKRMFRIFFDLSNRSNSSCHDPVMLITKLHRVNKLYQNSPT